MQGDWTPAEGHFIAAEASNSMFDFEKISINLETESLLNRINSDATVVLKQTPSDVTNVVNGRSLNAKSLKVGQCKIANISRVSDQRQDCFTDRDGSMMFEIPVTASTKKDSSLYPGVHVSVFWRMGERERCGPDMGLVFKIFQGKR